MASEPPFLPHEVLDTLILDSVPLDPALALATTYFQGKDWRAAPEKRLFQRYYEKFFGLISTRRIRRIKGDFKGLFLDKVKSWQVIFSMLPSRVTGASAFVGPRPESFAERFIFLGFDY